MKVKTRVAGPAVRVWPVVVTVLVVASVCGGAGPRKGNNEGVRALR